MSYAQCAAIAATCISTKAHTCISSKLHLSINDHTILYHCMVVQLMCCGVEAQVPINPCQVSNVSGCDPAMSFETVFMHLVLIFKSILL